MEWYLGVLKKYAVFDGRARRKEYWMFFLFNIIAVAVLGGIDAAIGTFPLLYGIYMLGVICPSIAVCVRRLHDTGKSGWWVFISFVPIIGGLWILYLMVIDGNPGDNQYGPSPKGVSRRWSPAARLRHIAGTRPATNDFPRLKQPPLKEHRDEYA